MLANKHPDYEKENKYLNTTCDCISDEIMYLKKEIEKMDESINKLKKSIGGNYSDEMVVKTTIQEANKRKYRQLIKAQYKPYFGRIDFRELGKDEFETFYIGKTSVVRKGDEKRLVIDWRAPIASLYYSGELGDVMYTAPDGLIIGELELKRQYEIENKKLINIFDKGLTPMDEFLQQALWQKKDNRLKDIVTTIQSEQNDIIRADKDVTLIVQGVAGSGKTTIVLHRIAYLMYTYQDVFTPENILIIVPNNLFLDYISDVLPDLGVEEINQATYEDLAMKLLNKRYNLKSVEDKLIKLIENSGRNEEYYENIKYTSWFKGSMMFKKILDKYIRDMTKGFVPEVSLKVLDYEIYSYEEVKEMFDKDYSYLPVIPRVERIKKYIKANIDERIEKIAESINEDYEKLAAKIKKSDLSEEEIRQELIKIYDERDKKINEIKKAIQSSINKYFSIWQKIDIDELYKSIITDFDVMKKYSNGKIEDEKLKFIISYCKEIFENGEIEREDLPAILYLKMKLLGLELKGKFSHIIVDEAQDYSQLQMYILRKLNIGNSFTIVGDLSQGIHSYKGIDSWRDLIKEVFDEDATKYLTIRKCYRSTMEIMNFANEVIKNWEKEDVTLAEPVLRSGDKPYIIRKNSEDEIIEDIAKRVKGLKDKGYKSIAVICKTNKESKEVYERLKEYKITDLHLITDKDIAYESGVVVIPTYLAKGLEFDAVFVHDCSEKSYPNNEIHIKLLYVSITRPLHELYIYYKDKPSTLIENISEEFCNKD